MKGKFIYKPFNTVFFTSIALYAAILSFILRLMSVKTLSQQKSFICIFYILSLVVFALYKYAISKDEYYWRLLGFTEFNWLNELPLNVCNIVLLFMPFGIMLESRTILGICFFASMILSPMALLIPVDGFSGYSIFTPRVFGYILTHFMAISAFVMMIYFNIFTPVMSDLPKIMLTDLLLNFLIYALNKFFRKTGLNPKSNYFYNVETEGNPAFELAYKYHPYEFVYSLPIFTLFAVASVIITIIINL